MAKLAKAGLNNGVYPLPGDHPMLTITIAVDGEEVHATAVARDAKVTRQVHAPPAWLAALEFSLTVREIEIVRLIAAGMQYQQVAKQLGISERTVRGHLQVIYRKMGIANNTMLVSYAWLSGILRESDIVEAWRTVAPHLVELA